MYREYVPVCWKKEKSAVFSLTYKYQETTYTIFLTPSNPPIINNYYNVQPSLLFQPLLFGLL